MMDRAYRVTGINLKRQPLGEADLLLTIFTREQGVLTAVGKGARKAKSKLGGRLDLFVVNDLQLSHGRSLDQILQGEVLHSFQPLSRKLGRLGTAQYWSEVILAEAVPGQPYPELFDQFLLHLGRLETAGPDTIAGRLVHGLYQLLLVSGVAPVVDQCTVTGRPLSQERAGFSLPLGGIVAAECLAALPQIQVLTADQVNALQWLGEPELSDELLAHGVWLTIERLLRRYVEFYLQRSLRSADLLAGYLAIK